MAASYYPNPIFTTLGLLMEGNFFASLNSTVLTSFERKSDLRSISVYACDLSRIVGRRNLSWSGEEAPVILPSDSYDTATDSSG